MLKGFFTRLSTYAFLAAVALFIAQLVPEIGIYLMFLGAGLWTGVLFEAWLALIALEVLSGYLPRAWLLLPLGALAIYCGMAVLERSELAIAEVAWSRNNSVAATSFAPGTDNLWFDLHQAVINDQRDAGAVLHESAVERAYLSRQDGGLDLIEVNATGACKAPALVFEVRPGMFGVPGVSEPLSFCITHEVLPPKGRLLTIRRTAQRTERWDGRLIVTTWTLSENERELGHFTEASATMMGWVPLVFIGCGLSDASSKWVCGATPISRDTVYARATPDGQQGRHPVSIMLNLPPPPLT